MVFWALEKQSWWRAFVPKIPSYRITDLAEAIGPNCQTNYRDSTREKIHEEMITASDSFTTVDLGKYYAILPSDGWVEAKYREAGRPINR